MDISKEYILMCEKAVEIQNLKKEFDYCDECGLASDGNDYTGRYGKEIWLPRQDQLQMLSKLSWQEFDWKCANEYPTAITKEQAGLMVVMEQFGKEWKDNKWIDKTTP